MKISSRKKLLILLAIAVFFPVTLLILVQISSLTDIDKKTKLAFRENLRQNLLDIERKTKEKLELIASRTLIPAGNIKISAKDSEAQLEKYFAAVKKSQPEIEEIFLFSFQGENANNNYVFVYSDKVDKYKSSGLATPEKKQNILRAFNDSKSARNFLGANKLFLFQRQICSECSTKRQETFIFYPLFDAVSQKQIGFAGITISEQFIRNEIIAPTVAEVTNSRKDVIQHSTDLAVSVFGENETEIFTNAPGNYKYVVETDFSSPFTNWKAKIGYQTKKFDSLAGLGFKERIGATFFFLALLIIGIALTIRATLREIRLAQIKSAFVSNVSHELKTPLSLISLFAEILELGRVKSEDKKHEYYRIIGDETRRLNKLIENVLDFSSIEAGRKVYNFTNSDISEVIENVISDYQYQIKNSGFELQTNIEENLPAVLIDRNAIAQAILNLLDNGIKYSTEIKKIWITVKTYKSNIMIEISDCGMGIPPKEQKKIFEKFYRVGNDLVHNVKGSGLGLALVKHIIEAHKGKITVKSTIGKGSCFTISIPFKPLKTKQQSSKTQTGEVYNFVENTNH